ncbi:S-formylglutathione hydrolase FrmB [Prauserella shujinwangii]|uniref:S-formylglutathione hydrolase FrmB n=1 Tax=Prauserella shujinwangii TaxID=1453103 RepID=A0A2T0LU84_9PSEU|nr:alpha/beta hydrolase [Prauserella shujinwangii]PRX47291.1 S-formylglutathione hydrolase FrmB [Prauserella shujinwangii]
MPGHRVGRRAVLLGGAGAVAAAGVLAGTDGARTLLGLVPSSPEGTREETRTERVYSAARGRHVDLVTLLPPGAPDRLPMCLLLHGRGGDAHSAAPSGLLAGLGGEVARGAVPPFGFVAVDGGDTYWQEHVPGDDPMAMVLDEVPGWLRDRGLGGRTGLPFACAGTSMGGFGALLYARLRVRRRLPPSAVGLISPALLRSWDEMRKRRAFRDRAEWRSLDPLRHVEATRDVPTGVWCGTDDPFVAGVREFVARARPEVAHLGPGGHSGAFFRTAVPGLVAFLGRHCPRAAR